MALDMVAHPPPTSDLMHMNARAVSDYLRLHLESTDVQGHVAVANELMPRVLYKADEALGLGKRHEIDAYAVEFARRTHPTKQVQDILSYLR